MTCQHAGRDVNTRRTKLLDLVGLRLVADVTPAWAVLSDGHRGAVPATQTVKEN
jgi:hypothetical protein